MFCTRVKEFLSQQGFVFIERNVAQDETAVSELERLGVMTTPVTVIDGEVVIGFDRERLTALLSKKSAK